jgi:hypothetical protein
VVDGIAFEEPDAGELAKLGRQYKRVNIERDTPIESLAAAADAAMNNPDFDPREVERIARNPSSPHPVLRVEISSSGAVLLVGFGVYQTAKARNAKVLPVLFLWR